MDLRTSHEDSRPTASSPQGKSSWAKRVMLVLTPLLVLGLAVGATLKLVGAAPAPYVSLPNSVAPEVQVAKVVGPAARDQHIQIGVSLHSRNEAGLKDYATQVAVPGSKLYHQYVSASQFALAFGPDLASKNAVQSYLQSQGLHLDNVASGGLFLQFSGTVPQVESAFHTHINTYTANGRTFYANASALQMPSALAPMTLNIAGTENARAAQHAAVRSEAQPSYIGSCPSDATYTANAGGGFIEAGMTPAVIKTAYNMTGSNLGTNVWAAMIEFDGFLPADLAQYATCNGLTTLASNITSSASSSTPFLITQNVSGGMPTSTTANFGTALTPGASAGQVSAELEILLGLVPSLKNLTVYQASNTSLGLLSALSAVANANAAQVVGDSWGMCEADAGFSNAQAEQQIFMQMALQGQTVLAATGNSGLFACSGDNNIFRSNSFAVMDPASDPFVTAVGGSSLAVNAATAATAAWKFEQGWNNASGATFTGTPAANMAGGGGVSAFWEAMSWQVNSKAAYTGTDPNAGNGTTIASVGVLAAYNNGSSPGRTLPDVAAAADPQMSSYAAYCTVGAACTGSAYGWSNMGGTALANAVWVATVAQAVQAAYPTSPLTGGRLGNIAPVLYALYQQDVTTALITNKYTQPVAAGRKYILWPYVLGTAAGVGAAAPGGAGSTFQGTLANVVADGSVLNIPVDLNVSKSVHPLFPAASGYSQPASTTTLGGSLAGYAVNTGAAVPANQASGYNALTGLGSPNVGAISLTGVNLAGYLSVQTRMAIPRLYTVAQAATGGTYWLASVGLNPYVQNSLAVTQWYQLSSSVTFTGAPAIVDDAAANSGVAKNLYVIGPTNTSVTVIRWNIQTAQTTTSIASAAYGTGCVSGVSAVVKSTGAEAGIICANASGTISYSLLTLGVTPSWAAWVGLGYTSSSAMPMMATNGSSVMVVAQPNTSGAVNGLTTSSVLYTAPVAYTTLFGGAYTLQFNALATTCTSTPGAAYQSTTNSYVLSCTASDTKAMWANAYNANTTLFGLWQLLGQPSSSVTFLPGAAIAYNSIVNDAGFGTVMYIAEGSDRGMYLNITNAAATNFLGKITGWQSISLTGIFNTNAAADFVAA